MVPPDGIWMWMSTAQGDWTQKKKKSGRSGSSEVVREL
jgi:hypothetical protein